MNTLGKFMILGFLIIGTLFALLSYNIFKKTNLYRIKNEEGKVEKFYIIDEEMKDNIFDEYEVENKEEDFDIINFFEKLNGDFKLEY